MITSEWVHEAIQWLTTQRKRCLLIPTDTSCRIEKVYRKYKKCVLKYSFYTIQLVSVGIIIRPFYFFYLSFSQRHIKLTCPDANFKLTINSDAFRSSRSSTALGVSIENCNLNQLDWRFLAEFSVLESMHLVGSTLKNNNMNIFPLLTSISSFSMLNCGNFDVLYPPVRTPHLIHLQIDNSFNVSDDVFERIISASADGPYRDSLQFLSLVCNKMTRIPSAIGNFINLRHLLLNGSLIQFKSFLEDRFLFSPLHRVMA